MAVAMVEKRSRKSAGKQPKFGMMDAEQTARSVGARLRSLRTKHGMTLMELAKAAVIDIATISRIETGKMTGTLECHFKLATALGIKVTDLYEGIEDARTQKGIDVLPPSERNEVYVHEPGKTSITLLTADVLKKKLMPVLITVEQGGSTQKEEARIGTERFLFVLDGTAEVTVGESQYPVKKGATLYLDASISHQIKNTGEGTLRVLSVITPPVL